VLLDRDALLLELGDFGGDALGDGLALLVVEVAQRDAPAWIHALQVALGEREVVALSGQRVREALMRCSSWASSTCWASLPPPAPLASAAAMRSLMPATLSRSCLAWGLFLPYRAIDSFSALFRRSRCSAGRRSARPGSCRPCRLERALDLVVGVRLAARLSARRARRADLAG
jgi:hypothetical protein